MSTVLDLAIALSLNDRISSGVKSIIQQFHLLKGATEDTQKQMDKFKTMTWTGAAFAAGGVAAFAGITHAIKGTIEKAAEFQDVMNNVKITGFGKDLIDPAKAEYVKQTLSDLQEGFEKLGVATKFSDTSAAQAASGMLSGGIPKEFLLGSKDKNGKYNYSGLTAAMYAAQLGEVDPHSAGDFIAKQRSAYNLTGDQTLSATNFYVKTASASTMNFKELMSGMLTASGVAGSLGMSPEDTAKLVAATGTYTKDGGAAGTFAKDFLDRLHPNSKKQKAAMSDLGWLKSNGDSIFFDDNGKIKNMDFIHEKFQEAGKKFTPVQLESKFHSAFLEQGKNSAIALATKSDVYGDISGNINNQLDMYQQVKIQMDSFNNVAQSLGETFNIVKRVFGEPFLDPLTNGMKKLNDFLGVNVVQWGKTHPQVIKTASVIALGAAAFMGIGGTILAIGGSLGALTLAIRTAGIGFRSFGTAASFVGRGAGSILAPIGRMLLAVGQVGARFAWLGIQATLMGTRMAAAWLIGLGPIGWIIMGAIAVIALFVAAWKNNWGHIQEHTHNAIEQIKNMWEGFKTGISKFGSDMVQIGKNIIEGIGHGFESSKKWLKDKWNEVIDMLPDTIASKLRIQSPSRVMMEHGKYIVQGLALGMMNNLSLIEQASSKVADTVTSPSGIALSATKPVGGSGGFQGPLIGSIVQQPGEDTDALIRRIKQELLPELDRRLGTKAQKANLTLGTQYSFQGVR
jgi:TP901 family phage tail tape measure protein